jgi:hypothetical protein
MEVQVEDSHGQKRNVRRRKGVEGGELSVDGCWVEADFGTYEVLAPASKSCSTIMSQLHPSSPTVPAIVCTPSDVFCSSSVLSHHPYYSLLFARRRDAQLASRLPLD